MEYTRNTIKTDSTTKFEINENVKVLFHPVTVENGKIGIQREVGFSTIEGGSDEERARLRAVEYDIETLPVLPEFAKLTKQAEDMIIAGAVLTSLGSLIVLFLGVRFIIQKFKVDMRPNTPFDLPPLPTPAPVVPAPIIPAPVVPSPAPKPNNIPSNADIDKILEQIRDTRK
jgi:hypothetical protein